MTTQIDRAGSFELGGVNLISYSSFDGDGTPNRLDIRKSQKIFLVIVIISTICKIYFYNH